MEKLLHSSVLIYSGSVGKYYGMVAERYNVVRELVLIGRRAF